MFSSNIKAMLNVWQYDVKCETHMPCDSCTARGMSARQGLGKIRHVDASFLWLHQAVQEGCLTVLCVPTSESLSDTFTKSLSQADADCCYRCMNYHMRKHMSPKNTESVTILNELQTISDASGNSEA